MIYSIDLRRRVVNFVKSGKTQTEAAEQFSLSRRTIYNWLKRKDLVSEKVLTRNGKINKKKLITYIENNSDTTLFECSKAFNVSMGAISKMLKKLKIVKKNDVIQGKKLYTKG